MNTNTHEWNQDGPVSLYGLVRVHSCPFVAKNFKEKYDVDH